MSHNNAQRGLAILTLVVGVWSALAQDTITVTTLNDVTDFDGQQQVVDLPGPDGLVSMREAVTAVNRTPGPQTIAFAIPQSEWWLILDLALLRQEFGAFILSDDQTTIDFTTQTTFTGDTNPNGWEVGVYGLEPNAWGVASIIVTGNHCTVRGMGPVFMRGHGVELQGDFNRVVACTISGPLYSAVNVEGVFQLSTAEHNVIGGVEPGDGNVLEGINVVGPSSDTVIIGNIVPTGGIRIEGTTIYGAPVADVRIGGPTAAERNVVYGNGGYGEEGFPSGSQISIVDCDNIVVQGNYVGVLPDGQTSANQRGPGGVEVRGARHVLVRDNLVSGIAVTGVDHYSGQRFGTAVAVVGRCVDVQVSGNRIGTDASGTIAVPNVYGVSVTPFTANDLPTNVMVGGIAAGQGNLIAFNERAGVVIPGLVTGAAIRGSSIYANGGLGIDLISNSGGSGVTPNDIGDADSGGNLLQNFPFVTAAQSTPVSTRVTGTLNSRPNQTFTIDFYASDQCDPSGLGQGQFYLAATQVTTNGSGNASFDAVVPVGSTVGAAITATATDAAGNTSEFGPCVTSTSGSQGVPGDVNGDGHVDLHDLALLLSSFGLCSGAPGFNPSADFDSTGCVELSDLAVLLAHFGS